MATRKSKNGNKNKSQSKTKTSSKKRNSLISKFGSPLQAALTFKKNKDEGMSPKDISFEHNVPLPTIYKYISIAETDKRVHKYVENGDIPATIVGKIIDDHDEKDVYKAVKEEVKRRREKKSASQETSSPSESKTTEKTAPAENPLQNLLSEIESQGISSPRAQFVRKLAEGLNKGATNDELVKLVK